MCCTTLIAQQATMSTTQLMRTAGYEVCWPMQEKPTSEYKPLRMNWVVVTDEKGNLRLRMCWGAEPMRSTHSADEPVKVWPEESASYLFQRFLVYGIQLRGNSS